MSAPELLGPDIRPKRITTLIDWISVAEEPPRDGRVVLVANAAWRTMPVQMGWRESTGQWRYLDAMKMSPAPTLWAELPEVPGV